MHDGCGFDHRRRLAGGRWRCHAPMAGRPRCSAASRHGPRRSPGGRLAGCRVQPAGPDRNHSSKASPADGNSVPRTGAGDLFTSRRLAIVNAQVSIAPACGANSAGGIREDEKTGRGRPRPVNWGGNASSRVSSGGAPWTHRDCAHKLIRCQYDNPYSREKFRSPVAHGSFLFPIRLVRRTPVRARPTLSTIGSEQRWWKLSPVQMGRGRPGRHFAF